MNQNRKLSEPEPNGCHRMAKQLCHRIFPNLFDSSNRQGLEPQSQDANALIMIYESEVEAISRQAALWEGTETGGHLHGGFTGTGDPVVRLATPPGPNARHSKYGFAQDFTYFKEADLFLVANHGASVVGRHHSHHELELFNPSSIDNSTHSSILGANNLRCFVEVIATTDNSKGTVRLDAYLISRDCRDNLFMRPDFMGMG
jgi:hypothetical protein